MASSDDAWDFADLEPSDDELRGQPLHVIVSSHAQRQVDELGPRAHEVLRYLSELSYEEITWSAQSLPSQHGRDVWLLWAGGVRVLFDIEGEDLTVQGFGLQPRF